MTQQSMPSNVTSQGDLDEVRGRSLAFAALFLVVAGGVASWLLLPAEDLDPYHLLIAASLFALGIAVLLLREKRLGLAQAVLLVGPVLTFALALSHVRAQFIPFFGALIVILNAAANPYASLGAALVASIPLALFTQPQELLVPALLLLWLTALSEWVSSRGLYMALDWVWSAQQRADHLVQQLRQNQGELNRTIAALTEATRRLQRIGHELAAARLNSDRLRELKSRFAANISHELRTPLNLILGFSETMHLTPDVYGPLEWPTALRQDVRRIFQSSKQLAELVDDVLDLSRIDGGEMPIHRETADLGLVIQDALELIRDLLRGRDLTLRADLPSALPTLSIDRARVRQVLVNLLNNAARFTERGSITVSASLAENQVVVSVADTGIGMAPEELELVFDEYHQVDMSLRTAKDGAGLGLAISKRFVELHGGRIWVESELSRGSTFYFTLPLDPAASYSRLIRTDDLRIQRQSEACVVLVENDPAVHSLLERYLSDYRIVHARSLEDAEAAAREMQPLAVVVNTYPEAEMQQEIAKRSLAAMPPGVPVVICSLPTRSWIARLAGADRCLVKPIQRDELIELLGDYPQATRIMIVDDDAGFVQLMARYLQTANDRMDVSWAYGGERALMLMRESPPDLLLLDLVMPKVDGLDLLKAMRAEANLASIPVVIVTATDYAHESLDDEPRSVQIHRSVGLGTMETMRYLGTILGVSQPGLPGSNAIAPPPDAAG